MSSKETGEAVVNYKNVVKGEYKKINKQNEQKAASLWIRNRYHIFHWFYFNYILRVYS